MVGPGLNPVLSGPQFLALNEALCFSKSTPDPAAWSSHSIPEERPGLGAWQSPSGGFSDTGLKASITVSCLRGAKERRRQGSGERESGG